MNLKNVIQWLTLSTLCLLLLNACIFVDSDCKEHSVSKFANFSAHIKEEKKEKAPKEIISKEEQELNNRKLQRHYKRLKNKGADAYKTTWTGSAYLNDRITGNWIQQEFQYSSDYSKGFRTIYSTYDKAQDKIYVISHAGHLWRIDRDENDITNTTWTILNNKESFMTKDSKRSLHVLNLPNGSSRMIRSYNNTMQYSDDEGRTWSNATGVDFTTTYANSAIQDLTYGQRIVAKVTVNGQESIVTSTDGINYLKISNTTYWAQIVSIAKSDNLYLFTFESGTIKTFRLKSSDSNFQLINTASIAIPIAGISRVFGTYANRNYHFYYASGSEIFYSDDEGNSWIQTRSTDYGESGDQVPRNVDFNNPSTIFRGFLDVYISTNKGADFNGTNHRLGWDVMHMKNYTKVDGTLFQLIGNDFGVFLSYTPADIGTYINLNHGSSHMLSYDADVSKYNFSASACQDRGTVEFEQTEKTTLINVWVSDGLRVTYANEDKSTWSWFHTGKIVHKASTGYEQGSLAILDFTGKWWANVLIASPTSNENAVYIGGYNQLKKFTLEGAQIAQSDHHYDFGSTITGFAYSEIDKNRWYISTQNGDFYYSSDEGATFTKSNINGNKPIANDQFYNYRKNQHTIKTSTTNPLKVYYAGVGNQMLISEDGGVTFTEHKSGLDVFRFRDIEIIGDDEYVFAACGTGGIWVYSSLDDYWYELFDEPIPNVDITSVEYIRNQNAIQFSTYGYGIMQFQLNEVFCSDKDNDSVCDADEYCSNYDVINNNSTINYDISVSDYIENNGKIDFNDTINFIAGNYIELTTGFEVNATSNFQAKIESCN